MMRSSFSENLHPFEKLVKAILLFSGKLKMKSFFSNVRFGKQADLSVERGTKCRNLFTEIKFGTSCYLD